MEKGRPQFTKASGMSINITFDDKKLAEAFKRLPKTTSVALRRAQGAAMRSVINEARHNHRFVTQSGNLERSMVFDVDKSGLTAVGSVGGNLAPYGRRIHEGGDNKRDSLGRRMTNRPDRFLTEAFDRQHDRYVQVLSGGISKALRSAGL